MKAELPGPVAGAPVRQVGGLRRPAVPGTWGGNRGAPLSLGRGGVTAPCGMLPVQGPQAHLHRRPGAHLHRQGAELGLTEALPTVTVTL